MSALNLIDLAPLAQVMFAGLVLALGPLAWIWLRQRGRSVAQRHQALLMLTLFLTFDLVVFGAFTRLSDSGLGCPDWPGCYGHASPVGAQLHIDAAQSAMPSGPVTHAKAWIEMVHRYLAMTVGVLILTLALSSWQQRREAIHRSMPGASVWWSFAALAWVCVQGAFGAFTVTMKLFPAIVTLHLIGGVVLLALLCAQAVRSAQLLGSVAPVRVSPALRLAMPVVLLLLLIQLALGGWVSSNYAVLACSEFPMCQGQWWPDVNLQQGFELWRPLGRSGNGEPLTFAALTAIHLVHRLFALVVLLALMWLAVRLLRVPGLRRQGGLLVIVCGLQAASGLGTVLLGWPLPVALTHSAGAAALVAVLVWCWCASALAMQHKATVSVHAGLPT